MKFALLFVFYLVYFATATDYCDKELCKEYVGDGQYVYNPHIACGNSGTLQPSCPSNAYLVEITPEIEKQILDIHNKYRDTFASGNLEGFESAKRLPQLRWNKELSELAELNALRCKDEHDKCHNTDNFPYSGQNIAISGSTAETADADNIVALMSSWWKEHKIASQSNLDKFDVAASSLKILHFTAMVHEKTADVGCGISKWEDATYKRFYIVCNYGFSNLIGEPIYQKGEPCSECTTGCGAEYTSLCTLDEEIISKP